MSTEYTSLAFKLCISHADIAAEMSALLGTTSQMALIMHSGIEVRVRDTNDNGLCGIGLFYAFADVGSKKLLPNEYSAAEMQTPNNLSLPGCQDLVILKC